MPLKKTDPKSERSSEKQNSECKHHIEGKRLRETLELCCDQHLNAGIVQPESGLVCQARFAHTNGETVIFDLLASEDVQLMALSTCVFSFFFKERAYLFLGTVRDLCKGKDGDPDRLILPIPERISTSQVRQAARIPVAGIRGLKVELAGEGKRVWEPCALDISLGGLMLEFSPEDDPGLEVGARCEVQLHFEEHSVKLAAEVRRHEGQVYGLFFPDIYHRKEHELPVAYRALITKLENQWLHKRDAD